MAATSGGTATLPADEQILTTREFGAHINSGMEAGLQDAPHPLERVATSLR